MKQTVPEVIRSQYAIAAIDALFKVPVFIPSEFYEQTGIPKKTANRLLQQLREQDIITALTEGGGRRATTYVFSRLIAITEGDRL